MSIYDWCWSMPCHKGFTCTGYRSDSILPVENTIVRGRFFVGPDIMYWAKKHTYKKIVLCSHSKYIRMAWVLNKLSQIRNNIIDMLAPPKNLLTEGVKIAKNWTPSSGMQVFMLFWAMVIVFKQSGKTIKNWNTPTRNTSFSHNFELWFLFSEKVLKLQKKWTPPKQNTNFHMIFWCGHCCQTSSWKRKSCCAYPALQSFFNKLEEKTSSVARASNPPGSSVPSVWAGLKTFWPKGRVFNNNPPRLERTHTCLGPPPKFEPPPHGLYLMVLLESGNQHDKKIQRAAVFFYRCIFLI